jgi:hypothetical protein
MRAASEAGLRIPEDIAFIGFDDIEAARFSIPALTTVAQPRAETARRLVELLFDAIDGKDRSMRHITLRCELKIRESCGAKLGNHATEHIGIHRGERYGKDEKRRPSQMARASRARKARAGHSLL